MFDIHRFISVFKDEYKKEFKKIGIKEWVFIGIVFQIYSLGLDRFGKFAIYHVFYLGAASIVTQIVFKKK